jgi:mannitol/fructose-specific phosphotransferase system IIA component (Ntr-type)
VFILQTKQGKDILLQTESSLSPEGGNGERDLISQPAVSLPHYELEDANKLGIVITRLDNKEYHSYSGEYSITVFQ